MDAKKTRLLNAALAGLLTAGPLAVALSGTAHAAGVKCEGVNECKGKGECGSAGHSCGGKNECKGKGWVMISQDECQKKGGKVIEEKPAKKS